MTSHLVALQTRLAHETEYLSKAKTASEVALRNVWISQIRNEIEAEKSFLAKKGVNLYEADEVVSDDDLLTELFT